MGADATTTGAPEVTGIIHLQRDLDGAIIGAHDGADCKCTAEAVRLNDEQYRAWMILLDAFNMLGYPRHN